MRLKNLADSHGKSIWTKLGNWYIQGYNGKEFCYISRQNGFAIRKTTIKEENGKIIVEVKNVQQKLLSWSQIFTIVDNIIKVEINFNFKIPPVDIVKGYSPHIAAFVQLAKSRIKGNGKLIDSGAGYMVLPSEHPYITISFPRKFQRYKRGVYYVEKTATAGITPTSPPNSKQTNYTIEFEVSLE